MKIKRKLKLNPKLKNKHWPPVRIRDSRLCKIAVPTSRVLQVTAPCYTAPCYVVLQVRVTEPSSRIVLPPVSRLATVDSLTYVTVGCSAWNSVSRPEHFSDVRQQMKIHLFAKFYPGQIVPVCNLVCADYSKFELNQIKCTGEHTKFVLVKTDVCFFRDCMHGSTTVASH